MEYNRLLFFLNIFFTAFDDGKYNVWRRKHNQRCKKSFQTGKKVIKNFDTTIKGTRNIFRLEKKMKNLKIEYLDI